MLLWQTPGEMLTYTNIHMNSQSVCGLLGSVDARGGVPLFHCLGGEPLPFHSSPISGLDSCCQAIPAPPLPPIQQFMIALPNNKHMYSRPNQCTHSAAYMGPRHVGTHGIILCHHFPTLFEVKWEHYSPFSLIAITEESKATIVHLKDFVMFNS